MSIVSRAPSLFAGLALLLASPSLVAGDVTFSDPTTIDNVYAPFVPGRIKLYRGRCEGAATASVDTFTEETRSFTWDAETVVCRVLEEKEFEHGQLVEVAQTYLAEDDAGDVYVFGEVSIEYADGEVVGAEPDSWLVGGPSPYEDAAIRTFDAPAIFMPAQLAPGDVFVQDNAPTTTESLTVLAVDVKVHVAAGKFANAVRLRELDDGEDSGPELRWIVPGIGTVKERAKGLKRNLIATSLVGTQSAPDEN